MNNTPGTQVATYDGRTLTITEAGGAGLTLTDGRSTYLACPTSSATPGEFTFISAARHSRKTGSRFVLTDA